MNRCQTYTLTLTNNLDASQFTNLHTHGLHISGESPADEVINTHINYGESYTYTYNIPCNHATGTHWYHPHPHEYTSYQLGNGAAGALIIEDPDNKEQVPNWLLDMTEMVFLVLRVGSSYLVNGQANPTFTADANEWIRFRIIQTGSDSGSTAINWDITGNNCETWLLAKDGVYLQDAPRQVSAFFVGTTASRADVAVRCSAAGSYSLGGIATLQVSGNDVGSTALAPPVSPCRPSYLSDLVSVTPDQSHTINMRATQIQIDGTNYDDNFPNGPTLPGDGVIQIRVSTSSAHPYHQHVNHFQLVDASPNMPQDSRSNGQWNLQGDWGDTLAGNGGASVTARFHTATFSGPMVMHCHISCKCFCFSSCSWANFLLHCLPSHTKSNTHMPLYRYFSTYLM
jgi:FtsP/CotA-like multicopper oxidase with cupredoxin domain